MDQDQFHESLVSPCFSFFLSSIFLSATFFLYLSLDIILFTDAISPEGSPGSCRGWTLACAHILNMFFANNKWFMLVSNSFNVSLVLLGLVQLLIYLLIYTNVILLYILYFFHVLFAVISLFPLIKNFNYICIHCI